MKRRQLIFFAFVGLNAITCNAKAEDITSHLYLPDEYETVSTTNLDFKKTKYKNDAAVKDFVISEEVDKGIAQQTALRFIISNRFNTNHLSSKQYNNDYNLDYEIGVAKNFPLTENFKMQLDASYYTFDPKSWYGHSYNAKQQIRDVLGNSRWQKELRGGIKLGYETDEGLMPYASFDTDGKIDTADRNLEYVAFAGVHKNEYVYAYDVGLRYQFSSNSNDDENWFVQGESSYFINEDMAISGYADYHLIGSGNPKVDYGYTLGASFKVKF